MKEVLVNNSESVILGLTVEEYRDLKKILCYKDPSKRIQVPVKDSSGRIMTQVVNGFKTSKAITKFVFLETPLIDKKGRFPTGLLYLVVNYFQNKRKPVIYRDMRIAPQLGKTPLKSRFDETTKGMPFTPYPEQVLAANLAEKHKRGIIIAPTGVGKSIICALILKQLQVPTLIVVPTLNLKKQLTRSLKDIFGENVVGPLENGVKKYNITVENVDRLDTTKPILGFDCVIVDEFHRSGAASYRKLNKNSWGGIFYKIGLTATPFRSQNHEKILLESVLSKVIFKVEYQDAVAKNYIVPIEAYYIEPPKKISLEDKYPNVYKELIVDNEVRNKMIVDMGKNLHENNLSTLILVKRIEHGEILQQLFLSENGLAIPFIYGDNKQNEKIISDFNSKKEPVIIGISQIMGEGMDTKPCEFVILAGMTKSKNSFMQFCGRGFRTYPNKQSCKIIIFKDTGHKWMLSKFKECIKFLKEEYGVEPVKI